MLLIAFAMTSLGLLVASRMSSFEGFGTIANFVIMPMFFLSGAVFPLATAPRPLQIVGMLNPLSYGVDALRGLSLGIRHFPLALDIGVLVLFAAAMVAGAVWAFCHRL